MDARELRDHARKLAPDDGAIPVELSWESVAELTTRVSHQMLNEVLDWRVVFLDRPLNPPG